MVSDKMEKYHLGEVGSKFIRCNKMGHTVKFCTAIRETIYFVAYVIFQGHYSEECNSVEYNCVIGIWFDCVIVMINCI